jgi:menaquinone-dependent protoporphyrinogen oxidase
MPNMLIIYSSIDGQTLKICQKLKTLIEQQGYSVTLVSVEDAERVDWAGFDKIVIGASIRYGRHSPKIPALIQRHRQALESKPNAFFSVNLVARKPDKRHPETNPYLRKLLKQVSWKPKQLAVFAGKIDYPSYSFMDRTIIRLIMWLTRGPTDPTAVIEFTDWDQVESFSKAIADGS